MSEVRHHHSPTCEYFLDRLDAWLAGELASEAGTDMQTHHDSCWHCQHETRLATTIDTITHALPEHDLPALARPPLRQSGTPDRLAAVKAHLGRLVDTWRQPLVFAPALLLGSMLVLLLLQFESVPSPQTVTVDGVEYSQAEILQAAADLEVALLYLDKYGSFPARLVDARLLEVVEPDDAAQEPTI